MTRKLSAGSFRQTISSRLEEAEALCIRIRETMQTADLCSLCFAVELLARECLVNAIVHGNGMLADNSVELTFLIGPKWIRLQISDQGSEFPWRGTTKKRLAAESCNGRGLKLCKLYADHVQFNRKGNRIALWTNGREREIE